MQNDTLIEVIQGRLLINSSECLKIVSISDIIRIELQENGCQLYTVNGAHILIPMALDEIEILLKDSPFFRVHIKHIINTAFLETFINNKTQYVLLTDGTKWPVSFERAHELVRFLGTIDINIITD